jgi:hypothetical protein
VAEFFIDTSAAVDGTGTEISPFNTTAGRTWGSNNQWRIKRGTVVRELLSLTGTVANVEFSPYGDGAMPVFDCEGVRATAFNTNSKDAVTVRGFRFINQDSSASGALSISGATGSRLAQDCEFENCRLAIGVSSSVNNVVRRMRINVGNSNTSSIAYGVRVFGVSSAGNLLEALQIFGGASLVYGTGIEIAAGTTTTIRRCIITARSCDGILARGESTGHVITNTLIAGDMKDLLSFEASHNNTVRNVTLWNTGLIGTTYPCVKLGNDFGIGTPANNNTFTNCTMTNNAGEIPFVISNGGAANTITNCHLRRGGSSILMRNDVFGGPTSQFLTLAQMQAAGYNVAGFTGDPMLDSSYRPLPGSPLLTGGADLGYRRDIERKQGRKFIGAYAAARLRSPI